MPHSELRQILHEYNDYFRELLPDGLPIAWDILHTPFLQRTVLHLLKSLYTDSILQRLQRLSCR